MSTSRERCENSGVWFKFSVYMDCGPAMTHFIEYVNDHASELKMVYNNGFTRLDKEPIEEHLIFKYSGDYEKDFHKKEEPVSRVIGINDENGDDDEQITLPPPPPPPLRAASPCQSVVQLPSEGDDDDDDNNEEEEDCFIIFEYIPAKKSRKNEEEK